MLIGFDYYVELESAKHIPVFVKPSKIRGMLAVEIGKRTRITFWDGNSYLVEGSITKVAETLFNPQKKIDRGSKVPAIEWQEKSCFEW